MNNKVKKSYLNVDKDFKAYSLTIIASVLIPMFIFIARVIYELIATGSADLNNYGLRMFILIAVIIAFGIYFLSIEFYIIFKIIKTKREFEEEIKVKHILFFVALHIAFIILQILMIIITIHENWLLLSIVTFVLLTPYFYLLTLKIKKGKTPLKPI